MFKPTDELLQYIEQGQNVLVMSHIAPDGDAVGSLLGMGALLNWLGKDCVMALQDPVPEQFQYLPGQERITNDPFGDFDLVIGLDASDPDRFGKLYRLYEEQLPTVPLLVIDHHITNTYFGTVNWVEPKAVATAELIFDLSEVLGAPKTEDLSLPLLNGLVTDTLCFRTPNVVPRTLEIAASLMEAGASLSLVTENALNMKPFSLVQLWAETLPTATMVGKVIYAEIPYNVVEKYGGKDSYNSGGLVNFLAAVKEASVAVVFTEREPNVVDASIRSRPGVDVSKAAFELGGGGHPQAAGCTIRAPLPEVKEKVVSTLLRHLSEQGVA
jgi:phosphoesterase RecJ-like protein